MTTTIKQGKSLLERYYNALPHETNPSYFPDRRRLEEELTYLLKCELCEEAGMGNYEANYYRDNKELLKEFRENFTWNQSKTALELRWDVIATYQEYKDFDTKEELLECLGQDTDDFDPPEVDPYDLESEIDRVSEVLPRIYIWKLKPTKEPKKQFEIVIKVETDTWDKEEIERHFYSLLGEDTSGLQFAIKEVNAIPDQCPSV